MTPSPTPTPNRSVASTRDAFGLVLVAHLTLILLGSVIVAIGGWNAPIPILASFLASLPFWAVAVAGSVRVGGVGRSDLKMRATDLPLGIAVGVATQLVVVPLVYFPLLRLLDLDPGAIEKEAQRVVDSASGTAATLLLVMMVCVIAPVVEEIMYRGVLLRSFAPAQQAVGLLVSAAVFGALHFQALQFLGLFIFGSFLGLLVQRTGRLAPAVFAHVAFNATTVVSLLSHR